MIKVFQYVFRPRVIFENPFWALIVRLFFVLFVFTVTRILFYLFNLSFFPGITFSGFMNILWGGLRFDLSAISYINSLYAILMLLPFGFRNSKFFKVPVSVLFVITNSLGVMLNLIDIMYYRYVLTRLNYPILMGLLKEQEITPMFFRYMADYWYLTLVWIFLIISLIWICFFVGYKRVVPKRKILAFLKNFAFFIVFPALMFGFARGTFIQSSHPLSIGNAGKYVTNPVEMNIVLNTPFSIFRTLNTNLLQKVNYMPENELLMYCNPVHVPENKKVFSKKNVVIIILESFGKEYIGSLNSTLDGGKYKGYTPFLDSLFSNGLIFCNAVSNGRKSLDAMPSIFASIPAIENPYILSPYSKNKFNSVASLLKEKGYNTLFFHGAYNGSMGFDSFIKLSGFDTYYGYNEFPDKSKDDGYWGIWDEDFFQFFAEKLNESPRPFLGAIFSLSSHAPYDLPAKYKNKFPTGPLPILETVGYADYSVRKFFETAAKMPWYDSTLFVITADHPSMFFHEEYHSDKGYFQVPVFFFDPSNRQLKGTDSTIAQHIDILPTIMEYLGYDKPFFSLGRNMLDDSIEHYAVVHNIGAEIYVVFYREFVLYYFENKITGLYNHIKDPMLKNNILNKRKDLVEIMDKQYKAFIQQFNNRMIDDKMVCD